MTLIRAQEHFNLSKIHELPRKQDSTSQWKHLQSPRGTAALAFNREMETVSSICWRYGSRKQTPCRFPYLEIGVQPRPPLPAKQALDLRQASDLHCTVAQAHDNLSGGCQSTNSPLVAIWIYITSTALLMMHTKRSYSRFLGTVVPLERAAKVKLFPARDMPSL